jgi:hypothetical protein
MKKAILFLGAILFANSMFSQFTPTGTLLTDSKFRSGAIGLGYTTAPTFGTNKLMVNGDFKLDLGRVLIGNTINLNDTGTNWGLKSDKPILIANSIFPLLRVYSTNTTSNGMGMDFAIATGVGNFSNFATIGDAIINANVTGSLLIVNERNGNIKFETGLAGSTAKVQMMIDNTGNIGIGTGSTALNPLEKLAVNGLIHTKEVKVDLLNWPDYVFEPSYTLIPLNELEQKIIAYKHLPEIPSAKEVEENGVLLGEMNKKLLQKVEELTLYMIQMNKEIELLKANAKN